MKDIQKDSFYFNKEGLFFLDLGTQRTIMFKPYPIDIKEDPIALYEANYNIIIFKLDILFLKSDPEAETEEINLF